jgi:hypothetical protein
MYPIEGEKIICGDVLQGLNKTLEIEALTEARDLHLDIRTNTDVIHR